MALKFVQYVAPAAPTAQRSARSCSICARLKIKCDRALPKCGRCVRLGKNCEGMFAEGRVLLDAAGSTKTSRTTRERSSSRTRESSRPNSSRLDPSLLDPALLDPSLLDPSRLASGTEVVLKSRSEPLGLTESKSESDFVPTGWARETQPPQQNLDFSILEVLQSPSTIRNQLRANWIEELRLNGTTIANLEPLAFENQTDETQNITLATALVYYGNSFKDKSALLEAHKIYGLALQQQRTQLESIFKRGKPPTEKDVCNALVFSLFGMIASSDTAPILQHLFAVFMMLSTMGPEACKSGPALHVYTEIRSGTVWLGARVRRPSLLAQKDWMDILSYSNRGPQFAQYDHIIDIIHLIGALLARVDDYFMHLSDMCDEYADAERDEMLCLARKFLTDLEETGEIVHQQRCEWLATERMVHTAEDYYWEEPWETLPKGPRTSPSFNETIGFQRGALIHVLSVLAQLEPEKAHPLQIEQISAQILIQAEVLICLKGRSFSFAIIEPLRTVHDNTPNGQQRARSRAMIATLHDAPGLTAFCSRHVTNSLKPVPEVVKEPVVWGLHV